MRKFPSMRMTPLVLLALLGSPGPAAAEDAATPSASTAAAAEGQPAALVPAPAETAAPEPAVAAPASVAVGVAEPAEPTSTTPATAEPASEAPADDPVPSYFRFDHDYMFGLQLWAGATYPLMDGVGLATDVYLAENYPAVTDGLVAQSWWGEFDIGPALTFGPLTVTPMAGIAFDWAAKRAVALNAPQLYTVLSLDNIYFESWIWTVLYSPFKDPVYNDYFHTRNWLLYKFNSTIGVGPQFEYEYLLNSKVVPKGTAYMPLGAHVELSYGAGNSLGLFLGYELDKDVRKAAGGKGAEGRISFVHNF